MSHKTVYRVDGVEVDGAKEVAELIGCRREDVMNPKWSLVDGPIGYCGHQVERVGPKVEHYLDGEPTTLREAAPLMGYTSVNSLFPALKAAGGRLEKGGHVLERVEW